MCTMLAMVPFKVHQMPQLSPLLWRSVGQSVFNQIFYSFAVAALDSFSNIHFPYSITFYRFYLFACARCNHGTEFLRRLHMNIEEVVHLLLFNLTLQFRKRYYNLTNVIYPYSRDNWHALQLPPKVGSIQFNIQSVV